MNWWEMLPESAEEMEAGVEKHRSASVSILKESFNKLTAISRIAECAIACCQIEKEI